MAEGSARKTDCIFLYGPRACGKSTVARATAGLLPGWIHVDIDVEYERRRLQKAQRESFDFSSYYSDSLAILEEVIQGSRMVVALGGGALANGTSTESGLRTLKTCVGRGPLVLVLPSRFDFLNRRVLYKREKSRDYFLDRKTFDRHYEERMPQLRQCADLTVFGEDPVTLARQIIRHFRIDQPGGTGAARRPQVSMALSDQYHG